MLIGAEERGLRANDLGATMAKPFVICPFGVFAGDEGGIVIEDQKSGQSWVLTNQQSRVFGRLITRQRRAAEKHLAEKRHARHACSTTRSVV